MRSDTIAMFFVLLAVIATLSLLTGIAVGIANARGGVDNE